MRVSYHNIKKEKSKMKSLARIVCIFLCIFTVISIFPLTISAEGDVAVVKIKIKEPDFGVKPETVATITTDKTTTEFVSVEWKGNFDENGMFMPGELYAACFTVKIKDGLDLKFADKMETLTINGKSVANSWHYSTSSDGKVLKVSYDFPFIFSQSWRKMDLEGFISKGYVTIPAPEMGNKPAAVKDTSVDSTTVSAEKVEWSGELDEKGNFKANVAYTAKITLRVSDNATKYFRYCLDESDFTVNKNKVDKVTNYDNDRKKITVEYTFPVTEDTTPVKPAVTAISEIRPFYFTVSASEKWVKPSIEFDENLTKDYDKYTLSISYDTPEVKPYDWYIVTATYKAKDGYIFTKDTKVNQPSMFSGAEVVSMTQDTLVVKIYTYTSTYYNGIAPTEAMKNYVERRHRPDYYKSPDSYVARGTLFNPGGRFDIPIYKYPTSGSVRMTTGEKLVQYSINNDFAIKDLTIADEIPDLEGKWYYLSSNNGFIPACFVDELRPGLFDGGPAVEVDSTWKFEGGTGTAEDPFLIATADQLNAIRFGLNYHYKLINDIDLSTWGNWVPIGGNPAYGGYAGDKYNDAQYGVTYFGGQLDGNGHVISGMRIAIDEAKPFKQEDGNTRYYGLFARFDSDFKGSGLRNLGLVDYTIDINYADSKNLEIWAGAFAGEFSGSIMENCYTTGGSINFNIDDSDSYLGVNMRVGGLAGQFTNSSAVKCYNTSDITINADLSYLVAAGLAAISIESSFTECFNTGDITLPVGNYTTFWRSSYVAGLVAETIPADIRGGTSYITNCYNAGALTANQVSGLFSYASNTTCILSNCYNVGKLTAESTINETGENKVFPLTQTQFTGTSLSACYSNGTSVSGNAWKNSTTLGRKVLKSIPEDTVKILPRKTVNTFADVNPGAYFEKPVAWAVRKAITTGTSATTFSPNDTCTRAQILTFLWRAVGSPASETANPFTDVAQTDYFYGAAIWAYDKGMVYGNLFEPNAPCTRAMTVYYMWLNAGSPEDSDYTVHFLDIPEDAFYRKAVGWAFHTAVTGGTSLMYFSPDSTCTRGQIATFLYRGIIW